MVRPGLRRAVVVAGRRRERDRARRGFIMVYRRKKCVKCQSVGEVKNPRSRDFGGKNVTSVPAPCAVQVQTHQNSKHQKHQTPP